MKRELFARGGETLRVLALAALVATPLAVVSCKQSNERAGGEAASGEAAEGAAASLPYDRSREGSRPGAGLDPRRAEATAELDSATDAIDEAVEEATDAVDEAVDDAVEEATDAVDEAAADAADAAAAATSDAATSEAIDDAEDTLPEIGLPDAGSASAAAGAAAAGAGAGVAAAVADAGNGGTWPMWGGTPSRNMVNTKERGIPSEWDIDAGKNIKWSARLGSQSYGNPVIVKGRVLVGTNNESKRNPEITGDKGIVMCFRVSDGEFLWQAVHDKLSQGRVNDWPEQGICSSPVVEGDRIWYVSNRCELVCADIDGFTDGENDGPFVDEKYKGPTDGDFIWVLDMLNELGVFPHNLATCSPLLIGNMVYVVTGNGVERDHITIPNPRAPSFLAVDKNTGEVKWYSRAPGKNILHGQWSNPTLGVSGDEAQVLFPGGDGWLYSFEPLSGKLIWKFDLNPKDSKWELGGLGTRNNIISTPVFADGHVYLAVGQDPEHGEGIGHFYSIAVDGKDDVTDTKKTWHYGGEDFRRTISTAAVIDGIVYNSDLSGFLHCIDQATGSPYWVHDMLAAVWGSPTVIDGKLFLGDEDGDIVVIRHRSKAELEKLAADGKEIEPEVIAEMNMQSSVYTGPVAVDGVLYIASRTHLYAIEQQ